MTREEAIKILKEIEYPVNGDNEEYRKMAFDMAIKALEQEPIFDRVRAEIEKEADPSLHGISEIGLRKALKIINKYKAETEE